MSSGAKLCAREPIVREFTGAIGHVLAAEHSELQHLFGRKFGTKLRVKFATDRFRPQIDVMLLHQIIHFHAHRFHFRWLQKLRARKAEPS
ncbi:MAG: hypothetical protein QOG67_1361 [Verrucomicrobiota bacterium]